MIDYRWSKLTPNFFGIHPSFLIFLPLFLGSFSFQLTWLVIICAILYFVFLLLASRKKLGPLHFASFLWCRFVIGFHWQVRDWS